MSLLRKFPPSMATTATSKLRTATLEILSSATTSVTHRRVMSCSSASFSPRLVLQPPDLIKWVRSKGGFVHPKLKIGDHPSHGLGLVSYGEIASGSELISLPDHLTLRLQWPDDAADVNSRPNSPLFQLVRRVPDVDASSLGWAMSAVSSRAFRLHSANLSDNVDANVPMLLPLIDMCNHSFHPNARIIQDQNSSDKRMLVRVFSETEIKQNVPITLNYGCLSNDLFLLDYGFVVPSNPCDHIELKYDGVLLDAAGMVAGVSCSSFSSPLPWQDKILSQLNLHGNAAFLKFTLGGSELVDGRLLAALRVLLANDAGLVQNQSLDTLKSLSAEAPLGVTNETVVLRTVLSLCAISLQQFPTKIMEDETLMKGDNTSSSMKLAVEFRIQKKSMIIDVVREISKRIRQLSQEKSVV